MEAYLGHDYTRRIIIGELKCTFCVIIQVYDCLPSTLIVECSSSNVSEGYHLRVKVVLPSRPFSTLQGANKHLSSWL